jgi:CubicO group peptidase (beta-lactamase class C family)
MSVPVLAPSQKTFPGSPALDWEVQQSIRDKVIPGGVLVVVQNGKVLHCKAYGQRAIEPAPEVMTIDTIFDVASLTKIVATTPSIMKLVEQGEVRLYDPVTAYLPAPIQVRSATVQHRRHGGANGRGKGRGQGL